MHRKLYEELYNPGTIKGTSSYREEHVSFSAKKMAEYMIPSEKVTLQQVYNIFKDDNVAEKKRHKDTLKKFKLYLSQEYPLK
ncbi:MAG: hypothetical protein ACLPWD_06560 [Methanobacterium sp.]